VRGGTKSLELGVGRCIVEGFNLVLAGGEDSVGSHFGGGVRGEGCCDFLDQDCADGDFAVRSGNSCLDNCSIHQCVMDNLLTFFRVIISIVQAFL